MDEHQNDRQDPGTANSDGTDAALKTLSPAAARALAEAEERRKAEQAQNRRRKSADAAARTRPGLVIGKSTAAPSISSGPIPTFDPRGCSKGESNVKFIPRVRLLQACDPATTHIFVKQLFHETFCHSLRLSSGT